MTFASQTPSATWGIYTWSYSGAGYEWWHWKALQTVGPQWQLVLDSGVPIVGTRARYGEQRSTITVFDFDIVFIMDWATELIYVLTSGVYNTVTRFTSGRTSVWKWTQKIIVTQGCRLSLRTLSKQSNEGDQIGYSHSIAMVFLFTIGPIGLFLLYLYV